jgi:hypothetical protein
MLWIDDIEITMAWYRDRLGFEVNAFAQDDNGRTMACAARLGGALILRDPWGTVLVLANEVAGCAGPGDGPPRRTEHQGRHAAQHAA